MTSHKILFTLSVLIASYATTAQYDTYEHSEEEDEPGDEKPKVDYSKYFNGGGAVATPGAQARVADASTGFVQPLDFNGFFSGGHFGLGALAGASQQVFNTPVTVGTGVALPLTGVYPSGTPAATNTSGFVGDVKFPSLFDSSSSGSENGFRPQDFLQQGSQPESTSPTNFYSPAFTTLQRDVDREVDYQRKEEDKIDRSRAASRRDPEYDSDDEEEEEEGEFDSFEFDDGPDSEYRSPQIPNKKPVPNERDESYVSPVRTGSSYSTPYSTVNQVNLQGPSLPRPVNVTPRRPLSPVPNEEDDYPSSVSYRSRQYAGNSKPPPINSAPNKHKVPYQISKAPASHPYSSPPSQSQQSNPYIPSYKKAYQRPIANHPSYYSAQSKQLISSPQSNDYSTNKPPVHFRPSPRDPYLASPNPRAQERRLSASSPKKYEKEGIYSLPQTEYATVVEGKPKDSKETLGVASKNNKECKRINKKIDPNDFARFKRQQMTCYICTNKEKGNTYEECSYESDPKSNAFYKGSTEAYTSDTILTPTKYQIRKRRSTIWDTDYGRRQAHPQTLVRKTREDDYEYDPDEQGHGPENYRFGPEYFQNDEQKEKRKRKPQKPSKRTDYDDEYDENGEEDETDLEKEYQPPGASKNDDCHKVNRNGLICMVCEKPNGRGTYEQCSYASDPEANRYEYAKSSSYGSKSPQNNRNKRYSGNDGKGRKKYKRQSSSKLYHGKNKKNPHRRGDFRNGKLKRKKVIKGDNRPSYKSANDQNISNISNEEEKIVGLDPFFYGSSETYNPDDYDDRGRKIKRRDDNEEEVAAASTEDEGEETVPTYEDSFYRLFPELVGTNPYTGDTVESKGKEKAMKKSDDFEHPRIPYEEVEDEEESESIQNNRKVKPGYEYGVELPDYYFNDDDSSKKDLEKTLDEFTHKNRSDCKKVMKDKMTCYQCINKNGLQHEECMFVAASEPKSKHLAYHEVKEFRVTPTEKSPNESTLSPSDNVPLHNYDQRNISTNTGFQHLPRDVSTGTIVYKIPKKTRKRTNEGDLEKGTLQGENVKYPEMDAKNTDILPLMTHDILKIQPKDIDTQIYEMRDIVGTQRQKRNPRKEPLPNEVRKRPKKENRRAERNEGEEVKPKPVKSNYNSVPPDPEGFDEREGPEGAYSHETEPVYDSILKVTLPRYMLTRSEHEDVFDEVFKSG